MSLTRYNIFDKVQHLQQGISEYLKLSFLCELVPVTPFYPRSWTMAHLVGIDKGPVLDGVDNNGLMEHYWIWKKRVEILFCRPLHAAGDGIKCNYLIYWAGETGMDLVDKWETKGKLTKANWNNINWYFELLEEHISSKSNALIAIVELKRLFQGTLSLEDFHTKALRLVKEAKCPKGHVHNQVLQDTIISGLSSDKICTKVIKEGKEVTLAWVMEIAQLEVSTQWHLDWMQETAKVNYVKYGRGFKIQTETQQQQWWRWQQWWLTQDWKHQQTLKIVYERQETETTQWCMLEMGETLTSEEEILQSIGGSLQRLQNQRTLWKGMHEEGNTPSGHLGWFQWFWSQILWWIGRCCLCTDAHGIHQPGGQEETPHPISHQCWSAESEETSKDPLSYCAAKGWHWGRCKPTQLINLWQDNLWQITTPTLSTLIEAYGNSTVSILGKFHMFLRWKGRVYKQLFYIRSANASLNLLSRDAYYMLGVLKLCYSVKTAKRSSTQTPKQTTNDRHLTNNGTKKERQPDSTKWSICKEQLQGVPLKKVDILKAYTDVFTRIWKFLGPLYKFQLKPNANRQGMHWEEFQFIYKRHFIRKSRIWSI